MPMYMFICISYYFLEKNPLRTVSSNIITESLSSDSDNIIEVIQEAYEVGLSVFYIRKHMQM